MQAEAALVVADVDSHGAVPKVALSQLVSMLSSGQPAAQQQAALQLAAANAEYFNFEAMLAGKVQVLSQNKGVCAFCQPCMVPMLHG